MKPGLQKLGQRLRHGGRWLRDGLKPPFGAIGHGLKPAPAGGLFRGIWQFFKRQAAAVRLDRSLDRADAPDIRDFQAILALWGIPPLRESIARCVRGLAVRCACLCLMSLVFIGLMLVHWVGRPSQWLVLLVFSCLILIVVPTHIWRIWVLKKQRFVPFRVWLLGGSE